MQISRAQPPFLDRSGLEILDHDIGLGQQPPDQRLPLCDPQIGSDRAFVAPDHFPPDFVLAVAPAAHRIACTGRFDLDHIGAHIAEQLPAERPGNELAQLDHFYPIESPAHAAPAFDSIEGISLPITPPSQRAVSTSLGKSSPVATPDRASR